MQVINFYMNMLMDRGSAEGNSKVHAFNTFFYPKIMGSGYAGVRRWTRRVDVFAVDYVLVPIHLGMHWCLAVSVLIVCQSFRVLEDFEKSLRILSIDY